MGLSVCVCAVMRPQLAPHQHHVSTCKPLFGDLHSQGRGLQFWQGREKQPGQSTNLLFTRLCGCAQISEEDAEKVKKAVADSLEWLDENSDSEQEDYEEKLKVRSASCPRGHCQSCLVIHLPLTIFPQHAFKILHAVFAKSQIAFSR